MAISIVRTAFDAPGDIIARPHANCYWLVPGLVLAGEHPGAITAADVPGRVGALLDAGIRQFVDLTEEGERPAPYASSAPASSTRRGSTTVRAGSGCCSAT